MRAKVLYSAWALLLVLAALDLNVWLFSVRWTNAHLVRQVGVVGYVLYDLVSAAVESFDDIDDVDPTPYAAWLDERRARWEPVIRAPQPRQSRRKNVVFLQLESIDAALLDAKMDGELVMPFLSELSQRAWTFETTLDQTGVGRSADAHILVLMSQIPIQNQAIFTRYDLSRAQSLPRILGRAGWRTFSLEGFQPDFWRWKLNHQRLGFHESFSMAELDDSERLGWGISDASVVRQATEKMVRQDDLRPFFCHVLLLSNHHPFNFVREARNLEDRGLVNDYFISARYTDEVTRLLFERLEALGIADETVVFVYSDHDSGLTRDLYEHLGREYPGDEAVHERIPLLIWGLGEPRRLQKPVGLQDLAPTVLHELGLPIPRSFVGAPLQLGGSGDVLMPNGIRVTAVRQGAPESAPITIDIGTLTRLAIERPETLAK